MTKRKRKIVVMLDHEGLTPENRRLLRYTYKHLRLGEGNVLKGKPMSKRNAREEVSWVLGVWLESIAARVEEDARPKRKRRVMAVSHGTED